MKKGVKDKAGRPLIEEKLKNKMVGFSASPQLIETIDKHAKQLFGGSRTKYIVHKLSQNSSNLNTGSSQTVEKIELYKLIKEVNKIGTNINQIARRTNLGFRKDEPLKNALSETENKIDELITLMNTIIQTNNPNFK